MNIRAEVNHIIKCAENGDGRIVLLGRFIFFSTEARDAWMLEPRERLALCLMRKGEKQPFRIAETPSTFAVEWDAEYRIDGGVFITTKKTGEVNRSVDYPTEQIMQMIRSIEKE